MNLATKGQVFKTRIKMRFINILPKRFRMLFWISIIKKGIAEENSPYIFKVAESAEEIKQGLSLIHDSYANAGLIKKVAYKFYFSKYAMLPSTNLLIGKLGKEVISSCLIVRDTPLGFPSERKWKLRRFKKQFSNIAEIYCLAVKKKHQKNAQKILFPFYTYIYRIAKYTFELDALIFVSLKPFSKMYSDLFTLEFLERKPVKKYFSKKVNSDFLFLNLNNASSNLKANYRFYPENFNLHKYLEKREFKNFYEINYDSWLDYNNSRLCDYYEARGFSLINFINEKESLGLKKFKEFEKQLDNFEIEDFKRKRQFERRQTAIPCQVKINGKKVKALISDISTNGLKLSGFVGFDSLKVLIPDEVGRLVEFQVESRWNKKANKVTGCELEASSLKKWHKLLEGKFGNQYAPFIHAS